MKKELLKLIASGKIEETIEKLLELLEDSDQEDLHSSITLLSARFNRTKNANLMGTIRNSDYNFEMNKLSLAIENLVKNDYEEPVGNNAVGNGENENQDSNKSVFISYSHKESIFALKMQASLEEQNIEVVIDVEDNIAGSEIESFIEKSIKNTSNTVSIISMSSLLSPWVSLEMIKTIKTENIADKNFIAAFIDDKFFQRDYPDQALDKIDIEINEIGELIKTRLVKGRNIDELQSELVRYQDLKFYFPKIIKRLNDSLSVDIRGDKFDGGMQAIIDALQ